MDVFDRSLVDLPRRETFQRLLDGDARLQPGERSTEAEVRAMTEADMSDSRARHVERIGIDVLTLVAPGRSGQQRDFDPAGMTVS